MDALRGIALIAMTPRLWGVCLGPLFLTLAAYVGLGVACGLLLLPHLTVWLERQTGGPWLSVLLGGATVVLWILLFPFLFVLCGGVFFGLAFEAVAEAVERVVAPGTTPPTNRPGPRAAFADCMGRLFLNGTLGLVAFLLGFTLGPIPGVIVAGVIGLLDYTAPAHLRRGCTLPQQAKGLLFPPDARTISFALVAGLLSLIPVLGVFLLPGLIAGGTLLTRERGLRS